MVPKKYTLAINLYILVQPYQKIDNKPIIYFSEEECSPYNCVEDSDNVQEIPTHETLHITHEECW